jgi:hypothetical protein
MSDSPSFTPPAGAKKHYWKVFSPFSWPVHDVWALSPSWAGRWRQHWPKLTLKPDHTFNSAPHITDSSIDMNPVHFTLPPASGSPTTALPACIDGAPVGIIFHAMVFAPYSLISSTSPMFWAQMLRYGHAGINSTVDETPPTEHLRLKWGVFLAHCTS